MFRRQAARSLIVGSTFNLRGLNAHSKLVHLTSL
ncbi:hypothetical protein GGQ98_003011 [Sphingosinicella soli]|uniref:Uncharacterized protein n=1 Tax=Sphingosinicella soli TaxID=333708 RepID=A0A7W7B3K4_9SPHN|nr:hypothetical protein [Sphingosinicella soli]